MRFLRYFALAYPKMTLITRPGFSTNTEVEASSFSVWNCVITFLQILLVSTILYGTGWSQGELYNITPENLTKFHHFRAIAFFFCVWALQSVALALLLVWAIGKRSYHLCHSWMLCEALMQVFIILSSVYLAYRVAEKHTDFNQGPLLDSNEKALLPSTNSGSHHSHESYRPPRHFVFLIILHFLIKGFGFWIVWRYMRLLKTTAVNSISNNEAGSSANYNARQSSPPPSYAHLCKDDLPCYDDALKLCLKDSAVDVDRRNQIQDQSQAEIKNTTVPV